MIIRRIDSKFDRKKELDINRFIETIRKKNASIVKMFIKKNMLTVEQ